MIMRHEIQVGPDSHQRGIIYKLMGMQIRKRISGSAGRGVLHVNMLSYLVAIKDEFANEWSFVNHDEESSIVPMLFQQGSGRKKLKAYH